MRTSSPADRVLARVEKGEGCWVYEGTPSQVYGTVWDTTRSSSIGAHIAVYELLVGPLPPGGRLHHTCPVQRCVRPDHLVRCLPDCPTCGRRAR